MDEKEKDYALKDILVADPNGDQTLQKAIVETVRGDYTLEYQNNDFISVSEFRKPGNTIPSETARKNYIYEIIEERMATINGKASNIEIKEVYSNGTLAGYSFTYDVVAERVGINLEERVYTATTYNDKRDLLMERKDTSQDQTILDAMNAAAAYRKKTTGRKMDNQKEGIEPDPEDNPGKVENQNPKNDSVEGGENTLEVNEEQTQDKPSEDELNNQEDRKDDLSKEEK